MSHLLDAVQEAAENREAAASALPKLMVEAQDAGHSLSEIGRAAGMSKAGARWVLRHEREKHNREESRTHDR